MTELTDETRRPHALYVAWGFPPSRGGGVYRALATVNGLVTAGFDVTVLTCERETFVRSTGVDPSLEAHVHPSIKVVRIPFEWPAQEMDIRAWPAERARDPQAWARWRAAEDRKDFPETSYGAWVKPLVGEAFRIHAERPVDLVIGSANPNVDVAPGLALHREFGVPFVYDHRDAWTLHLYTEEEAEVDDPRVAETERAFVTEAEEVWFVNEPISEWHRARYPESAGKIHTVANGFDPEFAPVPRQGDRPEGPVTFGYIGTMTSYMPMAEFADGWRLARGRGGAMSDARAEFWGYLGYFGTPHPPLLELFSAQRDSGMVYQGPVPKAEIRATYGRFDVLVVILGTGRFITSGKVYEYMASGLPVVSVHDPSLDTSRVLQDYPLWFPARSLEPDDVADALAAAAEAALAVMPEVRDACVAYAARFERSAVLHPRLEALRGVVDREVRS